MSRDWKALVRARLGELPVDPARAADIVDEIAQHVADHHRDLVAAGWADDQALGAALELLAHPEGVAREIARADRPRPAAPVPPGPGSAWSLTGLGREVRYALRVLGRQRAFALVAIATLSLGIGVNTAIFSIVNAALLKPLPYADPSRLVLVGERGDDGRVGTVGYETFLDWRERSHAFESMAVVRTWAPTLPFAGHVERVPGMRVSANYFRLLGARPALGRRLP